MRPIIGVTPLWDEGRNSVWMLPGYLDAIREAGGVPVIFPMKGDAEAIAQLCGLCDGFLLTGGEDVDPQIYGEAKSERCGVPNGNRDFMEREIFNYAIARDMPLMGICRGIQFINALLGGTLYQDLPSEYGAGVNHQMRPPYDRVVHTVRVIEGTPLSQIVSGVEVLGVNSYHHQAIKELSPLLEAMAISEDGLVEAVYMPGKRFVEAVQWHPELSFCSDDISIAIFRTFINKCR